MEIIKSWFNRHFSDPQVVILVLLLIVLFAAIIFVGQMLAPVIAAIVIAFLLDRPTDYLRRCGLPNFVAATLMFLFFIAVSLFLMLTLIPLITQQVAQLVAQLPNMVSGAQEALLALREKYPAIIDENLVIEVTAAIRREVLTLGQQVVAFSLAGITSIVAIVIYVILVPLLVFFFLKDKYKILRWLNGFLPQRRILVDQVWAEVKQKTGNYIRGKIYEIIIVAVVGWIIYKLVFGLPFATLLAVMTGLSVLIPYIGAAVVTVPVVLVALFHWGAGDMFLWTVAAYLVLQALDGNLLVPLLFSEVVKLHPIAIILAVLLFGGIWGFWGLVFAIPLATLVHAVIRAWPQAPATEIAPASDEADR